MDDYSFLRDLLETWRSTSDWVKVAVVLAIPGQIVFLIHQVLRHRADQRAMIAAEKAEEAMNQPPLTERRVRQLVEAEMCRIIAEWERAQPAQAELRRLLGMNDEGDRPGRLRPPRAPDSP